MAYLTWIPWRSTLPPFLGMHFLRQVVNTHVANGPFQPVGVFDSLVTAGLLLFIIHLWLRFYSLNKVSINSRQDHYLHLWCMWWVRTTESWGYQELFEWFLDVCWDFKPATYAAGLLHHALVKTSQVQISVPLALSFHATA